MLSDEEKKAIEVVNKRTERLIEELKIEEEDLIDEPKIAYLIIQIAANKTLVNLIEKQSKEIEELKEKNKTQSDCAEPIERIEEMVNMRWVNHNYILKTESEQRERKAYIKGTNDADELCNKKWEDKIKAKIGKRIQKNNNIIHNAKLKYGKDYLYYDDAQEAKEENRICKEILQSLLEKE